MKKITIYFILLLLFGSSSVFAQADKSATTEKSPGASTLDDPKFSPEERALLLAAGEDNPAKIDESALADTKIDPKTLATEKDYGESNAKPAEGHDLDQKLVAEEAQKEKQVLDDVTVQPVQATDQPDGKNGGAITNYRDMSAGKDQPRGEEPQTVPNYREMRGPDQQPSGDSPAK